jgi:hypothetical protein
MNPTDLLFLMIPAALAAVKFGLIAFAVVMVARGIFQSHGTRFPLPVKRSKLHHKYCAVGGPEARS